MLWVSKTDQLRSSMGSQDTYWALCPFSQAWSPKWAPVTRLFSNTSSKKSRWGSRRCSSLVRLCYGVQILIHNSLIYSVSFFVQAPVLCHPSLNPLWPWRTARLAVGLNFPNTVLWTGHSRRRCLRTRWPNWSSSSNTSTFWRNRNSTSSRST